MNPLLATTEPQTTAVLLLVLGLLGGAAVLSSRAAERCGAAIVLRTGDHAFIFHLRAGRGQIELLFGGPEQT